MRASVARRRTRGGRAPSFRFREGPSRLIGLQRSFGGFAASLCGAGLGGRLGLSARRFGPSAGRREIPIGRLARHLAVRRGNAICISEAFALLTLRQAVCFRADGRGRCMRLTRWRRRKWGCCGRRGAGRNRCRGRCALRRG